MPIDRSICDAARGVSNNTTLTTPIIFFQSLVNSGSKDKRNRIKTAKDNGEIVSGT